MSEDIKQKHLEWFGAFLVLNGAPSDTTDEQVRSSAGFAHSEQAFCAGWYAKSQQVPTEQK